VARALAASAGRAHGRPVAFFMRKGADVLSKWVGEAEQQLRLLFEARPAALRGGPLFNGHAWQKVSFALGREPRSSSCTSLSTRSLPAV